MISCINMPDNINTAMINSVKETIKSSTIWNKLVKTIENANINMEKLIQDSVDYGIEIGMFHQNKCGKIECKESKRISNGQTNDKFISPLQQKNTRNDDIPQMNTRSAPKSDSETTLSAYSSSKSIVTRTRKSNVEKELKRSCDTLSETENKRIKNDSLNHSSLNDHQKNKTNEQKNSKTHKMKPINKKMVKPIPICAFCLGDELINKRTKRQENMITCWDCGTCAHPTCLQWPDSLYQKVRTIRWQCLQCKRCAYCGMISKKDDDMLLCDVCDQGFHIYCCDPPIKIPPKGEWVCRLCRPLTGRKERPSIFITEEYEFVEDCQIVTPETVGKMCNLSPKPCNTASTKSEKTNMKTKSTLSKKSKKVNLLQLKKKKLVNKAVQRQRQALTDGLSKFFTPSNKRQSRVSKQSISSDSLFDRESKRSPSIASPKDKGSTRSIISSSTSKSPIVVDTNDEFGNHFSSPERVNKTSKDKKKVSSKKLPEISIYHSPNRTNSNGNVKSQIIKTKLKKYQIKKFKLKKIKLKPSPEKSTYRGPGRPKKILSGDKCNSVVDNVTESSSVTVSKNDLSTNYSMLSAENCESDPYPISDLDRMWYTDIQQKVVELLPPPVDAAPQLQPLNKLSACRTRNEHSEPPELSIETTHNMDGDRLSHVSNIDGSGQRYPPRIQIGRYIIDTWYSAPYPSEYARLNVLYICEYCLKPIKSYDVYVMHMEKCTSYFPPGNEIYRNGDLSVFEVDGYVSKLYCQQLCLLAKLFLDHKTLYYDVEPFLFYVAVLSKNKSSHIIGYFSKEKRSTHKYNLSCIMVLPPYQKYNYGRFLIDFSYLLSRKEGQCGSPEKPLSTLGRISYESYWKSKILPFILNKEDVSVGFYARGRIYKPSKGLAVTIDRVSTDTGISPHDVASTIQLLSKKVDLDNSDRISIQFDWEKLKSEAEKYAGRYPKWIPIDEECLRWVPLINPNEKSNYFMKSPTNVLNTSREMISGSENSDKTNTKITTNDTCKSPSTIGIRSSLLEKSNSNLKNSNKVVLSSKLSKKNRDSTKNNKSKFIHKTKLKTSVKEESNNTQKKIRKETKAKREEIVTRNKSFKQNSSHSSKEEVSPIKVDLTTENSENSDIPENDDCNDLSTLVSISKRKDLLIHKKPVFEMFKEATKSPKCILSLSPPKESPPINRNDPSPVSTVSNEIICPVLISPEIDEENEEETDIGPLINDKRRLILRLEKWDANIVGKESPKVDTIELSNDSANESDKNSPVIEFQERNVFMAMENGSDRVMEVVVIAEINKLDNESPVTSSPIASLSMPEDRLKSTVSDNLLEPLKVNEFVLPTTIKESNLIDDIDKPPTLSRISSLEDNVSTQLDDYSTSFNLPADISQNEEFKSFYNDGNVFNSITTSQTDSSDKDADESLLSISNSNSYGISDPELNGAYSCDSSICYNLRPRVRLSKLDDFFENPLRCSPGQSDLVQNHVSSTTPFVSPPSTETKPLLTVTEISRSTTTTMTTTSNSSTDSMKFDITFEDVGIVDVTNLVVTSQRLSEESPLRTCGEDKEDNNDFNEGLNQHNKINHLETKEEFLEVKSIEIQQDIHTDIVSSSLNETSTISDSSL